MKQSYYDQGERAGKLLAWRLKKKIQTSRVINSIVLDNRENLVDPKCINDAFVEYYENLYKSQYPDNMDKLDQFLDQLQLPTLSEETKNDLDGKLSIQELKKALTHMNTGKAPGPDGLSIELYKRFSDKLLLIYLKCIMSPMRRAFYPHP